MTFHLHQLSPWMVLELDSYLKISCTSQALGRQMVQPPMEPWMGTEVGRSCSGILQTGPVTCHKACQSVCTSSSRCDSASMPYPSSPSKSYLPSNTYHNSLPVEPDQTPLVQEKMCWWKWAPLVGSHVDQSAWELLWRRSSPNMVRTLSASKSRTPVGMTWTGLSPPHYSFALLHNI